jgi:hypothetical protein
MNSAIPSPVKPRETHSTEWYKAESEAALRVLMKLAKANGQMTIHWSQGAPTMIEVRTKIDGGLTTP